MHCTCSGRRARSRAAAALAALLAATGADAATTPCALVAPQVQAKAGVVQFEITVDCGPQAQPAKPFPTATDLLVGLTLYAGANVRSSLRNGDDNFQRRELDAAPAVRESLERRTASKAALADGAPKWLVLSDDSAASHDVTPKPLRIDRGGGRTTLRFDVDEKAAAGKQHFLFAAWTAAQRAPCKKSAKYARSGCRRDGHVLGSSEGPDPVAAYPGLEINHFEHPSGAEWSSERWIVERFR